MKLPWAKFFWTDYESDEALRLCSLAAQGLWMRMLCLMARAQPVGELRIGGEPYTVSDLSRAVGEAEATVTALLDELSRRGVYSVTRKGVIYNRRMRNGAQLSRKRALAGAEGAAAKYGRGNNNPDLPSQKRGNLSGKPAPPESRSQRNRMNSFGGKKPRASGRLGPFPEQGAIDFTGWADIARENGRNIDVNLLAEAFRRMRREAGQPLDDPLVESAFRGFCKVHRPGFRGAA